MKERDQQALDLRESGQTFEQIGACLGVSASRAREVYYRALRESKREPELPDWAAGLDRKLYTALHISGYNSKQSVVKGLESGAIGLHTDSGNGKIVGIGRKSIRTLRLWAGLANENEEVEAAIQLLEANGYKVSEA